MSNSALKQAVMRFYNAFNHHNLQELDRAVQPNWIIHPDIPGAGSSIQKYKPIAAALIEAFPDVNFSVQEIIAENDIVAVRAVITGTQQGTWLGTASANQSIQIFAHDFHRVDDNRIAESWHVEDWLLGLQQMTAIESHAETAAR